VARYASNFTPPNAPFTPDANTVGLYHFDEGSETVVQDSSGAAGGPSHGQRRVGGAEQRADLRCRDQALLAGVFANRGDHPQAADQ
jgi:hypothetical protein